MIKAIVFLAADLLALMDALAKEFALSRSEVMRRAMQHGVGPLRQQLESGETDLAETMSRVGVEEAPSFRTTSGERVATSGRLGNL